MSATEDYEPAPEQDRKADGVTPLAPGFYFVATPIGNLRDITLRALDVLRLVDRIACEDTRQTQKLLGHFGIRKPMISYHLHNERGRAEELVGAVQRGERIAVVSDAGTPGIADPGEGVVEAALQAGVPLFSVPGANAALTALVISGLKTEQFTFRGFLPSKAGQRKTFLERVRKQMVHADEELGQPTQILYETPHRIVESLADVREVFGAGHRVALARELTKLHEEVLRGTVAEIEMQLQQRQALRGEIVLLLDGTLQQGAGLREQAVPATLAEQVVAAMRRGASEMDALKQVAKGLGLGKSEAYREWQRTRARQP